MTQPDPAELIVAPAVVARRAGVDISVPAVLDAVVDAITDATVDVEGYLGRPVKPIGVTDTGLCPSEDDSWPTTVTPVIEIVSVIAEMNGTDSTGLYTVTYLAGIDTSHPACAPILRYITAAAAYGNPTVRRLANEAAVKVVKSVSADGQSISYADAPKSELPAIPDIKTLARWRDRSRSAYLRGAE